MNLTEHIDLAQIHANLPQMTIEDALDRMLASCRPRFPVSDAQWLEAFREIREDCLHMERSISGVLDTGVALLEPFSKSAPALERWALSVATFPAGAHWHFQGQPQTDRPHVVAPVRLAVLILPTNHEEFLRVLRRLSALFKPDTIRRLSCSETPAEILRVMSSV